MPQSHEEVAIPQCLTMTIGPLPETFLAFNDMIPNTSCTTGLQEEVGRMLVFSSKSQLRFLSSSKILYADGTFKVCPHLWGQLYILRAENRFGERAFVAAALLPNKAADTYRIMFGKIKSLLLEETGNFLSPEMIMSDFEEALQPVLREEFTNTLHTGCLFHYNQTLI